MSETCLKELTHREVNEQLINIYVYTRARVFVIIGYVYNFIFAEYTEIIFTHNETSRSELRSVLSIQILSCFIIL